MTESVKVRRFKAIILPYLAAAYRLARWLVRNEDDAQDLVQDAFLAAFKSFENFHGEDGKAWILTIVRNTCYRWLKKQTRGKLSAASLDEALHSLEEAGVLEGPMADDPEAWLLREENQRWVRQALGKLPLEFREVIVLREFEGCSYKEIASVVNIPLGTVMSRLARARHLLWSYLMQANEKF